MSYSDQDLEDARDAGIISQKQIDSFRHFIHARAHASVTGEEHFRLLTGFNDIFVAIAVMLVLVAGWYVGSNIATPLGPLAAAVLSWGLAEYFTRIRRMALPSILLLIVFVTAGFFLADLSVFSEEAHLAHSHDPDSWSVLQPIVALALAGIHWWRFKVPITVAAGMAALVLFCVALFAEFGIDWDSSLFIWLVMALGLVVLAVAISWDMADRLRTTRKADVAFWLHLLAAPLIVHPLFDSLIWDDLGNERLSVVWVLLAYAGLTFVSLLLDRRALMVSALGYALYAAAEVLVSAGQDGLGYALASLILGGGLLMLSALWQQLRALVIDFMPDSLADRLPPSSSA